MRVNSGRSPAVGGAGSGGGGGSVTTAAVNAASYTAWSAGTYPVNTWFSHDGKICMVNNAAGTSSEPPSSSNADWLVFDKQGDVEKYFADLLS